MSYLVASDNGIKHGRSLYTNIIVYPDGTTNIDKLLAEMIETIKVCRDGVRHGDYASNTVGGTVKVRFDSGSSSLYIYTS